MEGLYCKSCIMPQHKALQDQPELAGRQAESSKPRQRIVGKTHPEWTAKPMHSVYKAVCQHNGI